MKNDNHLKCYDLLSAHPKLKNVARIMVITFIILLIGLAILPWQQTAAGTGKVVATSPNEREQDITAPVAGRLGKWYVHDGSHVKKGDPIVRILDNDPELLKRLDIEKQATLLRYNTSKEALKTADRNVKRQKTLFDEGISSRRKYEEARFEYIHFQNEIAKTRIALTEINIRIARLQNQLVKAPVTGTIIRRRTGQESVQVKDGQRLAVLIPKTKSRAVELWLQGNDIPLIRKGQSVRLQFEGWPAIQFSGWPSVAVGTFAGKVTLVDPIDNGQGYFRILIEPEKGSNWPGAQFLRQGVRVHGWVLLSRVKLWYELWRRANGFPPVIAHQPEA